MMWVNLIYTVQEAEISLESERFSLHRGVQQGCPLSPLLFNMVIEILALWVQQNVGIDGVWVFSMEHKVSLFINDAVFILCDAKSSFKALQKVLTQFGSVSGYKRNKAKSIIISLHIT